MMRYFVYCHIRPDTNEVFYVGKGTKTRISSKSNRNQYWHRIVSKAGGFAVKVIAGNLLEKEALAFEILMIKRLKDIGIALCNMTLGGDGISGYKHTEKTRQKFSARMKGKPSLTLGKPLSEAHRIKLRLVKLGKKQSAEHKLASSKAKIGFMPSNETRQKIAIANTGKKASAETLAKMSKPVLCLTNNAIFPSIKIAAETLGLYGSNISKCCKGVFSQTGGYKFSYAKAITA